MMPRWGDGAVACWSRPHLSYPPPPVPHRWQGGQARARRFRADGTVESAHGPGRWRFIPDACGRTGPLGSFLRFTYEVAAPRARNTHTHTKYINILPTHPCTHLPSRGGMCRPTSSAGGPTGDSPSWAAGTWPCPGPCPCAGGHLSSRMEVRFASPLRSVEGARRSRKCVYFTNERESPHASFHFFLAKVDTCRFEAMRFNAALPLVHEEGGDESDEGGEDSDDEYIDGNGHVGQVLCSPRADLPSLSRCHGTPPPLPFVSSFYLSSFFFCPSLTCPVKAALQPSHSPRSSLQTHQQSLTFTLLVHVKCNMICKICPNWQGATRRRRLLRQLIAHAEATGTTSVIRSWRAACSVTQVSRAAFGR